MQTRKIRWNRVAIVIAGGLGILLLACVVVWALAPNLRRILQASYWKTNTELAAQAARKMIDYDLPTNYQEHKVLTIDNLDAAVIIVNREQPNEIIYITSLQEGVLGVESWRNRYEEDLSNEMGEYRFTTRTISIQKTTVRGQPTQLRFLTGTDENNRRVRQAICAFTGKSGDLLLAIVVNEENWNEAMVSSFLKSIR